MLSSILFISLLIVEILALPQSSHPTGTQQGTLTSGPDYQSAVIWHHNRIRTNHGVAPLSWDSSCASNASVAVQRCVWEHYIVPNSGQGQNIFASYRNPNVTDGITERWYKNEYSPMMPLYGQATVSQSDNQQVGHLTAMVWKGTTKVGCVTYNCGQKMVINGVAYPWFTACNYYPAGNVIGQYATNVAKPNPNVNVSNWHWYD